MNTGKSIEEEWEEYRDMVYPKGIGVVQEAETRQAFFSGGLVVMTAMASIAKIHGSDFDAGERALKEVQEEILRILEQCGGKKR